MMRREPFGTLGNGQEVERLELTGNGLKLAVITHGAAIQHLSVETARGSLPVTLGFARLEDYVRHARNHIGAIAGRFANRIRGGRFSLDGRTYVLDRNENGVTHLHGGRSGFGRRVWSLADLADDRFTLALVSPDGEEGYPGRLDVTCMYRLAGPCRLVIELEARTDAPTVVNLAAHSYFNLAGARDIGDHILQLHCDRFLEKDDLNVPTGEILPVAGTGLDFRQPRPVWQGREGSVRYDHAYVVSMKPSDEPRPAARLTAPDGDLALEVWSTEPGLQFYDGGGLAIDARSLCGRALGPFSGLCLEPQRFPDSPNHPHFPSAVLRPGERYRQVTEYRFSGGALL